LKSDPQQDAQVVHLLGCSVQVAQGALHVTQVELVVLATDPAGQLV
jgi:hypothetical protein